MIKEQIKLVREAEGEGLNKFLWNMGDPRLILGESPNL